MSIANMITELIGKNVVISDVVLGTRCDGKLVEIEDKWLKLERTNRKGEVSCKIISVDSIGSIEVK